MAILAVDEVMLREPRLLVPGGQPLGQVALNNTHPMLRHIAFFWHAAFNERAALYPNNKPVTTTAGGVSVAVGYKSWVASSGKPLNWTDSPFIKTSDGIGTGDFSIAVMASPPNEETKRMLAYQTRMTSAFVQGGLIANCNTSFANAAGKVTFATYDAATSAVEASSQTDGLPHLWMGVRSGSDLSLYRDGILVAGPSTLQLRDVYNHLSGQHDFSIGALPNADTYNANFPLILCAVWNRALSGCEALDFGKNPYQFLIPA